MWRISSFIVGLILCPVVWAGDTVTVTLGKARGAIDARIYGTNFLTDSSLGTKLVRFGGNGVSRFNPVNGKYNNSFDWDFSNVGELGPDTAKPYADVRAIGAEPIVQTYLLGYVSSDRTWGSVKVDPVRFSAEMVYDLNIRKKAGIKLFGMDNEPDCWQGTHADVFKHKLGYDEYIDVYLRAAEAMKKVDPSIQLLGPVAANEYFYTNLNREEDKASKGPWLPYFLKKCNEHDKKWGKRSLDYLDIHRYPGGGRHDSDSAALEVAREWWDTSYTKEPIILTMQKWIKDNYPGTKLSISEYGFGTKRPMCNLIWVAQNLGLFGKMGVSAACKWDVSYNEKLVFGLYGRIFGDQLIDVTIGSRGPLECYSSLNNVFKDRILVIINKDLVKPHFVSVAMPGFVSKYTDRYCISEGEKNSPVLSHESKLAAAPAYECPPLSVTVLRFRSGQPGVRTDFVPPVPTRRNPAELTANEQGGGYSIDDSSHYFFYHASVIDRDLTGFDSFKGSGDTGLRRGGSRDQVATDKRENHTGKLPDSSLVWFDNSSRITRSKLTDALLFDWEHKNRGWVDCRIAHNLKWEPQDLSSFTTAKGALLFYVKPQADSIDFTVYLENTQVPERTVSVLASDYVAGGKFKKSDSWQEVKIPLDAFDLAEQGIDVKRIRYIGFGNAPRPGSVKMVVDDIAIIKGK